MRSMLEQRIASYVEKHPYQKETLDTFDAKLQFCQFSDYSKIVTSNWQNFQGEFGSSQVFEGHMKNITELRNALKHGRDVANHDLASGEGGLLWLEQCLSQFALENQNDETEENGQDENGDDS